MAQAQKRKLHVNQPTEKSKRTSKLGRPNAASQIASIIEGHMDEMGLSEQEKAQRVSRFAERVDRLTSRSAKS
jgi:hypothetical protein